MSTTRAARQARIVELVSSMGIRSQTELARLLAGDGIEVTQATLSRDLAILCEDGTYELKKYTPVDQFPESVHVETVVLLSRA